MHGVSKITSAENVMLISFADAAPAFMAETLQTLADAGILVDMISQTAPAGGAIRFCFTAPYEHFDTALKVMGGNGPAPMISGGYSKINLYGEEMVHSVGVAARALHAMNEAGIDIALITTSDLDISLLVRQEEEDVALDALKKAYELNAC